MMIQDDRCAVGQQNSGGENHNQKGVRERDSYIDLCRAMAFVLVVLHHSGTGRLGRYILGFHMPVFFIVAGMTFNIIHVENRSVKRFSIKRLRQLVVPYFVFELLNLGLTLLLEAAKVGKYRAPLLPAVKSILLCINNSEYVGVSPRFWFLPCMALSSIIFVAVLSILGRKKKNTACYLLLCVSLSAHYLLQVFFHKRLPFTLDISLLAVFYISFGYLFKESLYGLRRLTITKKCLLLGILGVIYLLCVKANSGHFYMYVNTYGDYFNSIVSSIIGSIAFLLAMDIIYPFIEKNSAFSRFFDWINRDSVMMFPIHLELLPFVTAVIGRLIPNNAFSGILIAAAIMALMYCITSAIHYANLCIQKLKKA